MAGLFALVATLSEARRDSDDICSLRIVALETSVPL